MEQTAKEDPKFRRKMYILMASLLVAYIGLKSWHIYVALQAYEGQVISRDTGQPAK